MNALESLGDIYFAEHKYADAERVLREAVAGREKVTPASWNRFAAESLLGGAPAAQRRFDEAEKLIVGGYQGLRQVASTIPAYRRDSLTGAGQRVVYLYTAWGKPDKAAEWRKKLTP